MENYIQHIELINDYLNKRLSEKEIQDFENRLKTDDPFAEEFDTHVLFLEGLNRQQLKGEIKKAKQSYIKNKWLKYLGLISALVLVLLLIIYFNGFNPDKEYLKGKLNFESEYIQSFQVITDSIIEIVGEKGTVIQFNPKDLETNSKKPFVGDSLKVELIELTTKQDLLLANAQTASNKKWLISGGAFKIDIKERGKSLVLKEGKTVKVIFPRISDESKMELFYGERGERGYMNWKPVGDELKFSPYIISIEQSYVVDADVSKQYGVDYFKEVYVCDTIGFMRVEDINVRFPRVNFYNYNIDTLRFLKEHVKIIDGKYDCDSSWIDSKKTFKTENLDSLYQKKEVVIDSILIDLDIDFASECREIWGEKSIQISKQEHDTLKNVFSRTEYDKQRSKYYMGVEEAKHLDSIADNLYRSVEVSKLGWINIDKFALNEEKVNVRFDFNIKTNHREVYIIDESNNTVLNVYNNDFDLPINRSFSIIAIGVIGENIYGFKKSVRFRKKKNLKIDFKKVNKSQIRSILFID